MATIQKFYFHEALSTNDGSLPGANTLDPSGLYFALYQTDSGGYSVNRLMDGVPGSAQTATTWTKSLNDNWTVWHRRHLSVALAAQSIAAGSWTLAVGGKVLTTGNMEGAPAFGLWVWRPLTGQKVATIWDVGQTPGTLIGTSTETGSVGAVSGAAVTLIDGDILVIEWGVTWSQIASGTTGTVYHDGTTDPTDNVTVASSASYLLAPAALTIGPTYIRAAGDTLDKLSENLPPQILRSQNAFQDT